MPLSRPVHYRKINTSCKLLPGSINLLLLASLGLNASTLLLNAGLAGTPSNLPYALMERGPFYRVFQRDVPVTNFLTGEITHELQRYTELGDGLYYLDNGQWADSKDLIEITPNGAAAVHGQLKVNFSPNLNTVGSLTLTTPSGQVFQSHPLGLYYFDAASGKSATIAPLKDTIGQLAPPNRVVYTNAFEGLNADMLYVYAKEGFEQNVVLLQAPPPPDHFGLAPETSRLEVWTAFDQWPKPQSERPVILKQQTDLKLRSTMVEPDLVDHLYFFTDSWFPVGTAFAFDETTAPDQPARVRLTSPSEPGHVPVAKRVFNLNGQTVLIESADYLDLLPKLKTLQQASLPAKSSEAIGQVAQGRQPPPLLCAEGQEKPLLLASAPYTPRGLMLDYSQLSGPQNSFVFSNGWTYVISNSFSVGPGTATFQNNLAVKYATNAYLLLDGAVSFPGSGFPVFFTSTDDNMFGEPLPGSTGFPNYAAAQAIWMYFHTVSTTVSDARFRWAQRGIQYDENPGVFVGPTLSSSAFVNCNIGVYLNIQNDSLTLSSDTQCETVEPVYVVSGNDSGTVTTDCGVVSVATVNTPDQDRTSGDSNKNSQSECSFVLTPNNGVVAAFFDTHLSEYDLGFSSDFFPGITSPRSIGWAVSASGGTSFTDKGAIPPVSPSDQTQGDAGDPVMARDTINNVIYLLGNPSRESGYQGFRLWKSTDNGQNFSLDNTNVPGDFHTADKPTIAVNNYASQSTSGSMYSAGTLTSGSGSRGVVVARSSDGGATWIEKTNFGVGHGADIAIRPDGTVYVFYLASGGPPIEYWIEYRWLPIGGSWSSAAVLNLYRGLSHLSATGQFASGDPKRSNSADAADYFVSNGLPRVAVNPVNGRVYVVYADVPSADSTTDRGNIYVQEGVANGTGALTWSSEIQVNNDRTPTDQWNPSVAASPDGNWLFIGYYSRQTDPTVNARIKAYGAKAYVPNGIAGATFDTFAIDSVSFTNLFVGTVTSTPSDKPWLFDNVWAQTDVCLDTSARVVNPCPPDPNFVTLPTFQHFTADDYTWAAADSSYFYFAWRDCYQQSTHNWGGIDHPRADPNIRFGKLKQFQP